MTQEKVKFDSTLQVLNHLYDAGYKISDSKIYRDKKAGLLKVNPDGTVDEAEVRAYAAGLQRRAGNIDDLSDLQQRKSDKEIKLLELKEKKMKFELDRDMGKYIPRKDFEAELAARAAIFETGLKHYFSSKIQELVALVGGKPEKSPEFMQRLNAVVDEELSRYATTKNFHVVFIGDDDATADV